MGSCNLEACVDASYSIDCSLPNTVNISKDKTASSEYSIVKLLQPGRVNASHQLCGLLLWAVTIFIIIIIDAVEAESGFNDFIGRPCIPLQLCVSVSFILGWSKRKLAVSEWTSIRGTTIRLRNSYNSILSRWFGADFSPLLFLLLNLYLKLLLSHRAPKNWSTVLRNK